MIGTLPQTRMTSSRLALHARPFELASGAILRYSLVLFLLLFGLNLMFGLGFPPWVLGTLALVAGVLLLMERFRVRVDRRP